VNNDKTGGAAFPYVETGDCGVREGMTLRDYFAAKALPMALEDYRMTIGRIGECLDLEWDKRNGLSSVAAKAYEMADAMLEARK
jgi:hypothetical protein